MASSPTITAPIAPANVEPQTDVPSKKRAREDDEETETDGQGSAKKVDVKEG